MLCLRASTKCQAVESHLYFCSIPPSLRLASGCNSDCCCCCFHEIASRSTAAATLATRLHSGKRYLPPSPPPPPAITASNPRLHRSLCCLPGSLNVKDIYLFPPPPLFLRMYVPYTHEGRRSRRNCVQCHAKFKAPSSSSSSLTALFRASLVQEEEGGGRREDREGERVRGTMASGVRCYTVRTYT